ncbi:hypothetical protein [Mucilaginibacter kameinonensis]|uniref:hypothetical protein n=1 Tax=Mucilaginibacter kameinonensis TaxID=452286 RepID=UPI000EF78125|nr:hypothetical protein [Mucilaginibacter kameinonensis]
MEIPYQGRVITEDNFDYFKLIIPAKKSYFFIIFLCVWLCGWFWGERTAITELLRPGLKGEDLFLLFWLCGWTFGGIVVLKSIFWDFFGKEIIEVGKGTLAIKRKGDWFSREKVYDLNECKSFRVQYDSIIMGYLNNWGNFNRKKIMKGAFAFDYGMETIRFGENVEEAEAKYILDRLKGKKILTEKNF